MSIPAVATIRVIGMRFWGRHGAAAAEREHEQPIDVDVEVVTNVQAALETDSLKDSLDYTELYRVCERVVTTQSCALLETIAERISSALLDNPRVGDLVVRVRKPRLLDGATPEVEVRRSRVSN